MPCIVCILILCTYIILFEIDNWLNSDIETNYCFVWIYIFRHNVIIIILLTRFLDWYIIIVYYYILFNNKLFNNKIVNNKNILSKILFTSATKKAEGMASLSTKWKILVKALDFRKSFACNIYLFYAKPSMLSTVTTSGVKYM